MSISLTPSYFLNASEILSHFFTFVSIIDYGKTKISFFEIQTEKVYYGKICLICQYQNIAMA